MGQLFRRRPELVEAVQYDPLTPAECVVLISKTRRRTKTTVGSRPTVQTTIGPVMVARGDWIVTYADGSRAVYPPEMFSLAFEPA